MKNKLFLVSLFVLAFLVSNAQQNSVNLVSSTDNETVITFNVDSYNLKSVVTQNGKEVVLSANEASQMLKANAPDMVKFTKSIIIPDEAKMQIEVVSSKFKEINLDVNIAPSKGNLTRDIDPASVPYVYGEVYNKNEFFPGKLANLNTPYIARDFRGQAVDVYPFQYNPVTNTLRIYTEITVKISSTNSTGENIFNRTRDFDKVAREFNNVYSSHFLNYNTSRYTAVEEDGNMLIICYDDWTSEMQPLVDWKNTIGRSCEMITVTDAGGTASAIATYVENYYNDNGLAYLLLIGDDSQVPTLSGGGLGGHSDNAYAYITGDDHYLEFFVGRFSAESTADVATQVERTIEYEKGNELTSDWLNKTMGVASSEGAGSGDDGEADWQHYRNMAIDLLDFTYTYAYENFDGSQGGNDASGSPSPSMVGNDINEGVGMITYTGHGSETAWSTSGYSVSDINNLTNDNKLPFIWSVACVNGAFVGNTCFGEAWLRATNGNEPTGAVGVMAATINQSWAPPMSAQDEMVDILVESYQDNIKRTFAGISINGCFLMNDEYADFAMTDTWVCFGDPSLLVRTDNPSDMVVTHNATIFVGQSSFEVNCDLNGSVACLSNNGVIIGVATVSGGIASIPVTDVEPGQELTIAITGFNKTTYLETITVIAPEGPYITIDNVNIGGSSTINYGETQDLNITLTNVGPEEAIGITATLTSTDQYVVSLTSNTDINFGNVAGNNGTATSSSSFCLTVADNVPDQHIISFDLVVSDNTKTTWESTINVTVNAPVLEVGFNAINDNSDELSFITTPEVVVGNNENYTYDIVVEGNTGNGIGILDPGETVAISVNTGNVGHANLLAAECTLTSTDPSVTVNSGIYNIGLVEAGTSVTADFNITIDKDATVGESVELIITFLGGEYQEVIELRLPVGLQIEGFESGDFSAYAWTNLDMEIQTNDVHEGTYAAHSTIAGQINSEAKFEIEINVINDGQVSFYKKVSCENGNGSDWDYLEFLIDGQRQEKWDGEVDWSLSEFDISAGVHTLTWKYIKDNIVDEGDDCAWVDNIIFPGHSSAKSTKGVTITATTLPTWLTLNDNGDGTASLTGTTPSANDSHPVVIQAQDAGDPTTQQFTIVVGAVTVETLEGIVEFYPNPTSSILNINLPQATESIITLTDLSGKIVEQYTANTQNFDIDLSNKSKGVYMLKLQFDKQVINQKIIVN